MFLAKQAKQAFDPISADQGRPGSWFLAQRKVVSPAVKLTVASLCVLHPCCLQIDSLDTGSGQRNCWHHTQRADERLSVKQSNSHGYWLLTEDQALFALVCHNDAASLI